MNKYTELFTIPIAFLMLWIFNAVGKRMGWALYGIEVIQKVFVGFVLFLVVIGLARLVFMFQFPNLYKYIDKDFNENELWDALDKKQKMLVGLGLFALFCLLLTLLTASV
jgi:hypothetical protein